MDQFVLRTQLTEEKLIKIYSMSTKLQKKKTIYRASLIYISIILSLSIIIIGYYSYKSHDFISFIRSLITITVIFLVIKLFAILIQNKYVKANKWMLGNEIIYSIGEEGIEIQHINGNTSLKWDAFTAWTEDADYFYLCEHRQYIILEKTLFLNNEELRFKELLNRKIDKTY